MDLPRRTRLLCVAVAVAIGICSCTNEKTGNHDQVPPAAVSDLVVGRPLGNTLGVAWTATGDDSTQGKAAQYDLRYSTQPITEENWDNATRVPGVAPPFEAGYYDHCLVQGLAPATTYYFAVKVQDKAFNWSTVSNVGSATTQGYGDTIPPSLVSDLIVDSVSSSTISLSWTAPGDDSGFGRASYYDIRFSVLPIYSEIDWFYSARLTGEPAPVPAGTHQSLTVTGLTPDRHFYFALKAGDEITNWSALSDQVPATTAPAEIIPPAAITDLTLGEVTFSTVELIWTAPGDDGDSGTASAYDVRYNVYPIAERNWQDNFAVPFPPKPAPAGTQQSMIVRNLTPFAIYHFAIKTGDEIPNWSPVSNEVTAITDGSQNLIDTIPPARIKDLAVIAASSSAVTLSWHSPGDDRNSGTAIAYDIRYSLDSITDANWGQATQVVTVIVPHQAGTYQLKDIEGLTPAMIYFFAIKTADEVPNWSGLSNVASGKTLP